MPPRQQLPHPDTRHLRVAMASWRWIASLAILLSLGTSATPAHSQSPPSCDELLAEAEERYVARAFSEAEELIRLCLALPEQSRDTVVRAHRLQALVFLRQDDLPEAREAVLRLLSIAFDYHPDPVQDPPAYVALVTTVRDQLTVTREPFVRPDLAVLPPTQPADQIDEDDIRILLDGREPPEEVVPTEQVFAPAARTGLTRWLLIGGGVVAAGVAGVLLTGGSSAPPPSGAPLPTPPPLPR